MNRVHAICLVVDGLRASALGAYGNTSYPTPQLDSLAGRSLLVDWLWADSPSLPHFYRSAWQGRHALRADVGAPQLTQQLHNAGVRQWLVTDDPWLTEQSIALPFAKTLLLETSADQAAASIEETQLAQMFSETILQMDEWRQRGDPDDASLLWLHASGLMGPWDAPLALREELLQEDDPVPLEFVNAPDALRDLDDPDEIHAYRVAYAAQMAVVDSCVGAFLSTISESFADTETLVMLLSSSGYALGEHRCVGSDCWELFGERLHLPWLLHVCGNRQPLQRHAALAQPTDIGVTLLDWFGQEFPAPVDGHSLLPLLAGQRCPERQIAVSCGHAGEQSIRTPAWHLRKPAASDNGTASAELYVKPDDLWEYNEVASRCPQVVDDLSSELEGIEACARNDQPLPTTPGNSELP